MEEKKLMYGRYTENLIEISMAYVGLAENYPNLKDTDSTTWKQEFIHMANQFEEEHTETDWDNDDYLLAIENYAKEKVFEFGGIEHFPWYFTFGSWEEYPYHNTYLVVYAADVHDAVEKYRKYHPDIHEDTVNCAEWYSQKQWDGTECQKAWKDREPAEIIR